MCLEIKDHIRIALKPIKVYKIFIKCGSSYYSPYQQYFYKLGKTYRFKMRKVTNYVYDTIRVQYIYNGIHAYYDLLNCFYNKENRFIGNAVVIECTIPRFTPYYLGTRGDIVSSRLKIGTQLIKKPK